MLNPNFIYVGIALNLLGFISYVNDTIKGKIQPNRVSFFLWSIPPIITFFAELNQGVGFQAIMPLSVGLIPFFVFLATFINKKSYAKIQKLDIICAFFSILGIILWYITNNGNIAIMFSILADAAAYVPTLVKSYNKPQTESAWPWLAAGSSGFITLLTIKNSNFANITFPLYYLIINVLVYVLVQYKIGILFKKKNTITKKVK